jgi:hypothetical protein
VALRGAPEGLQMLQRGPDAIQLLQRDVEMPFCVALVIPVHRV